MASVVVAMLSATVSSASAAPATTQRYQVCSTEASEVGPETVPLLATDCTSTQTVINSIYDRADITVPVVFHVITKTDGVGRIDAALIQSQLEVFNQIYNPPGSPSKITFQLAARSPTGAVTTGIEYVVNNGWFADPGPGPTSPMKAALVWDPARYLNFYTNDGGNSLGYATLPFGGITNNDGVVMAWNVIGRNAPIGAPYDLGTVAAHEVGHYFGLFHTFNNGCGVANAPYTSGDLLADTTPTAQGVFTCGPSPSGCNFGSQVAPADNYMDYSVDACRMRFTPEQFNRVRCSAHNYRARMVRRAPTASFVTTMNNLDVAFENTSVAEGTPVTWRWDFGDSTISDQANPSHTYSVAGTYTVTLDVVADSLASSSTTMITVAADPAMPPGNGDDGGCQSSSNRAGGVALSLLLLATGLVVQRRRAARGA
jgi:uncharacterized protein (TIGR03382 family)